VIPLLAVAGSLAQKKLLSPSAGTFPTHSSQFVGLLVGVILIMGGLTYFPAVSLGPAVEQVAMNQGKLYPAPCATEFSRDIHDDRHLPDYDRLAGHRALQASAPAALD